jgi:hypothetical protein
MECGRQDEQLRIGSGNSAPCPVDTIETTAGDMIGEYNSPLPTVRIMLT